MLLKKKSAADGAQPKLRRKKPSGKQLIRLCALALVLAAAGFGCYRLFFTEDAATALTDFTTYGALTKTIEGTGTVLPAESQSVTAASRAEILEVFVSAGDTVAPGDPLYIQDDSEVDDLIEDYKDEITDAQLELDDYYDQLAEAREGAANLVVYAPFSGRLLSVDAETDDDVMSGTRLMTLVDDSSLTLTEYFSYAYEDDITPGMSAQLSVSDEMLRLDARVTKLDKVDYVTADGMRCFAVTFTVENPGSLTDGMAAAAWVTAADGTALYPAEEGTLAYANSKTITAGASGTVSSLLVSSYERVTKGQKLLVIESDTYESRITSITSYIERLNEKIALAEENILEAEESRADYAVCAEIAGKIIYCNIEPGDTPNTSMPVVMLYNLDTVSISVNIDELDVDYLSVGTDVTITRSSAETSTRYTGTITELSLEASSSNGVAYFPCTIAIDSGGALSAGVSVSYSISVGDTEEGVLAPVAALKSTGEGYCLFVKADSAPENAVDLGDEVSVPAGFYAVPVEVGTSNAQYVRVTGVEQDTEVFTRYQQSAPSGGGSTSENLGGGDSSGGFPGGMQGGNMPDFSGGMPGGMQGGFSGARGG